MTDFYSVLKSSIAKRDLRSPAERQEVYEQARAAMVRKLWTLDPPLSEDEIDARIGLFDDAVRRIEADLQRSSAGLQASDQPISRLRDRRPTVPLQEPPSREPTTYGRSREAAVGLESSASDRSARPPGQQGAAYRSDSDHRLPRGRDVVRRGDAKRQIATPQNERAAVAYGYNEPDEAWFSGEYADVREHAAPPQAYDDAAQQFSQVATGYEVGAQEEPAYDGADEDDRYGAPYHPEAAPDALDGDVYEDEPYRHDPMREAEAGRQRYEIDDPAAPHRPQSRRRTRANRPDRDGTSPDAAYEYELEARETGHEPPPRRSPKRRARPTRQKRKSRGQSKGVGRKIGQVLAITAGALAVVLMTYIGYVFLPIIAGSEPVRQVAEAPPPKSDDRLPPAGTATAAARIASDSATATEIPERNLNVAESLVIFNGTDPTVFEGSSNNPILFDSDSEGGFARVSSATSAAGARVVIGPGLAERVAGQTVRVTLLARSSTESGAASLRFAYQSGLAMSHWQSADLASSYSTYGMIWRVPATHTASGDYLLIEPGIPGDGTSTDIRQITIDILAS